MTGPTIENSETLCDHGERDARETLVDAAEHALAAVQPERLLEGRVERRGNAVVVDGEPSEFDGECHLLGAGKGVSALAGAVADVLGDRIDAGFVVEKRGQARPVEGVEVVEAGHPLPDEDGLAAAERLLDFADAADENDLVLVCVTGGASALLPAPADGVDGHDLRTVTADLLAAGAPIEDVNAVRKHLSRLKGGRLARRIHPAETLTLVVVDEVAGEPWGPTVPDETTYGDAVAALERHDAWTSAPPGIRDRLERGRAGDVAETPTAEAFDTLRARSVVLADAATVCEAARERAEERGYESAILSTTVEGESRDAGSCLAAVAREAAERGRPLEPPCAFVTGGETTVDVCDDPGEGGPNQEFALGSALALDGLEGIAVLAIDTDGTDGPTAVAGGLVDGGTATRAAELGVDLEAHLATNDATPALRALDDAVCTGGTGTNLMDLRILLVEA